MGIWHARFWVCLALLSLLMELAQGPKPIGAWWAAASVATERNQDPEQPSSPAACAMADSEGEEDSEPDGGISAGRQRRHRAVQIGREDRNGQGRRERGEGEGGPGSAPPPTIAPAITIPSAAHRRRALGVDEPSGVLGVLT